MKKGEWTIYDQTNHHPFYEVQNQMKVKADSLISKMYGYGFRPITQFGILMARQSIIRRSLVIGKINSSANLRDSCSVTTLNWTVTHRYERLIEFELDKKRKFYSNPYEKIFGLKM